MISISVAGKPAIIKGNSTFEFIRENNFFDNTDGYTLDMEFPLKDCPENIEVFGRIGITTLPNPSKLFPCKIRSGRTFLQGSLSLMEFTESSVKCQFLEGVDVNESESVLEKTYINEMNLGQYPVMEASKFNPRFHMGDLKGYEECCLPWTSKEYGVLNNGIVKTTPEGSAGNVWSWDENTKYLSWQPSLVAVIRRITANIGYTLSSSFDRLLSEEPRWNKAIICNSLPGSWQMPEYKHVMPHWNVLKFFDKLGYLMNGKFEFDHIGKTITYSGFETVTKNAGTIVLDNVIDEFSSSVSRNEKEAGYSPAKKLRYKDSDTDIWKYWCCPGFLKNQVEKYPDQILTYANWNAALSNIKAFTNYTKFNHRSDFTTKLIYIRDIDTYFLMRANFTTSEAVEYLNMSKLKLYAVFAQMTPVNIFGPDIVDYDPEESYEELDFVPVIFDWTEYGQTMILPAATYDDTDVNNEDPEGGRVIYNTENYLITDEPFYYQKFKQQMLERGDKESSEFYDRIYIGFRYDSEDNDRPNYDVAPADIKVILSEINTQYIGMMRLSKGKYGETVNKIDPRVVYTYSFISDKIPNINATYNIKGSEYVCSKLTTSFTSDGMSQIIKGEFYRITK